MFKKTKFLFVLSVLAAVMATPVHAEKRTVQIPVTVEGTDRATVTIASDDQEAMDAVVGDKSVTVGKSGVFTVSYDEPADFVYTITQTPGEEKTSKGEKITYDTSAYTAHVFVEAKEDGSLDPHVIVWKTAADSKSASVNFKNTIEIKNGKGAQTSDESSIGYQAAALAAALGAGAIVFAIRKKCSSKKEKAKKAE